MDQCSSAKQAYNVPPCRKLIASELASWEASPDLIGSLDGAVGQAEVGRLPWRVQLRCSGCAPAGRIRRRYRMQVGQARLLALHHRQMHRHGCLHAVGTVARVKLLLPLPAPGSGALLCEQLRAGSQRC